MKPFSLATSNHRTARHVPLDIEQRGCPGLLDVDVGSFLEISTVGPPPSSSPGFPSGPGQDRVRTRSGPGQDRVQVLSWFW